MDKNMELLLQNLDAKLDKQAEQITLAVTKNIAEAINEKLKGIIEENKILKNKEEEMELKLKSLEKEKRKNNLVLYGVEEIGKSERELLDYIKDAIEESGVPMNSQEISNVYRIGRISENKNRPVVISLTTQWKKHLILKNKSNLPPNLNFKEDFSKETLEKRKQLQPMVEEEKKKGNIAFIKYDKLVVKKPKDNNREKRRRESSDSPNQETQKKASKSITPNAHTQTQKKETIRPSILNCVEKTSPDTYTDTPKN